MFNSTNVNNSPRTTNTDLYANINETTNGMSRSFLQPKVTSTPLVKRDSIFATPPKHSILSPRRYSLSEIATPPRQNRRDFTKIVTTGPLLASTKYNINVSTYEDTKSPGLASRIVQYNEEAERDREQSRPPTHQAKYGSPGLFPVVHLFKKKLPVLEQKPKRVTIRIASPEYSRHHSQEYNRKLLEGIVKPSSPTFRAFSPNNQSSSTRSVLDALKEISRKRIHTNEEYDLNEDSGKRLRTMNNGDTNKRLRDDSPLGQSPSPTKPTSKRVCMYDEYAASCSSTDFSFKKAERQEPKRKSISISTLTDNLKESKQVKLLNAETQTVTTESVENTRQTKTPEEENQDKTEVSDESVSKKKSPLKIFDDAPLERIRKNRLAALMGSLTGKEPVLLPKPDYASVLNSQAENSDVPDSAPQDVPKTMEKPLVSILLTSPKKSSPTKLNKHVRFRDMESTSQANFSSTSVLSFPVTSVAAPVSSASETKLISGSSGKTTLETPAPPSSPVGLQPSSSDTATVLPAVTFGSGSNSSSATSVVSKESSTSSIVVDAPKTGFSIPNFQFKSPTSSVVLSTPSSSTPTTQLTFTFATSGSKPPATTTPPKMGGFKFDLSKPVVTSTATVSSAPTFSFGSTQPNANKTSSNLAVLPSTSVQNTAPENFSFGVKAITATPASSSNFSLPFGTAATSSSLVTASAAPTFTFGPVSSESKAATLAGFPPTHNSGTPFGVTSATTSVPAFGTNTITSSQVASAATTSVPAFGTSNAPFFSFGASKTTSASSGFGVPPSTTSSPITFGAPLSTSNGFGTSTSSFLNTSAPMPTPGFGVVTTPSTLSGGFGPSSTTSNAGFGTNASSMFGVNKTVSPFGVSTTTTPAFGTSSTTNSSPFGKSSAPQFGQSTTQPTFGTPVTTTSFVSSNAFGATTTTTSSSVFGVNNSPSVFATKTNFATPSNNANIFGGPVNTQPSNFGTSVSKPMFGSATTSPFAAPTNTTTTPSFGSNNPPTFNFGAKTTANSSFGGSNSFGTTTTASSTFGGSNSFGTTTTASTGFGNSTTPAFGTANSFGGPTNFGSGNAFGTSSTPAFGIATTSTQPSGFGVTTTPSFGTASSGFNAVDKNSTFGSSSAVPAFGSNSAPPFGASTTAPGFGTASNVSGFGTNASVSAFAKPQTTQNPFGGPNSNAFGTNNSFGAPQSQASSLGSSNPSTTQNAVFSFGATSPPKPPGVFSFGTGASNDVPKPTFNFTSGSTAPPAFGSSGTPSFGGSGPAPFGAPGIPQFGSPQAGAQGMFSIGSGSSTGKARTHLKPKRRT